MQRRIIEKSVMSEFFFKSFSKMFRSVMGLNAALNMMDSDSKKLFFRKTAKEFIWGYDDTLSSLARQVHTTFC